MEAIHLAYALVFLLAIFTLRRLRRRGASPPKQPRTTTAQCPYPNPLLGNTLEFIRNRRRFFDWYTDLLRAAPSGAIEAWGPLGAGHAVTTASPADVDHLLRAGFAGYAKGALFRDATAELIGDGLFAADGRLWSLQRKLASHAFSSRALRRFSDGVLAAHLRRGLLPSLDAAAAAAAAGRAVDLQDALRRFGFSTICHVAFGVEAADGGGGQGQEALFAAFDAALEISFRRALTPATWVRRLTKLLDVGRSRRLREAVAVIDGYAMSVVESKEAARQRNEDRDGGDPDLLSRFMAAMDEDDGSELGAMFPTPAAKRRFLRDVVVTFVLAGKDTTSSALTWFFWLLAANPRCERRAHEEAAASCGGAGDAKGMHYLHAALTEAMRLYPPVPFNGRVAVRDDELPSGAAVRAGWYANYSAYAMGRMKELWGDDCMEFVPERWLGDGGEFVPVDAARYPVFHAGPRVCLGKEMAYVQMKTVAAAVLRRFRVDVVAPVASMDAPPAYEMTATMKMNGGLWVRLCRREESAE
uniref:Cytochrome P450 n=1 Tax=Echinochloa phyllopogon TaxID=45619 RepID=R4WCA1_9POAL|nr:cytochrome P450 [Echinochloa phyllopogon]